MSGHSRRSVLALAFLTLMLLFAVAAQSAQAASPAWRLLAGSGPTNLPPQVASTPGTGTIAVYAMNVGGADTTAPYTMTISLPAGITTSATPPYSKRPGWNCTPGGAGQSTISCTDSADTVQTVSTTAVYVPVQVVTPDPGTLVAHVTMTGGGALAPAVYDAPITVSFTPASAGVQAFWAGAYDADGNPETRAGAHPNGAITAFMLNTTLSSAGKVQPAGTLRDAQVDLPAGFVANPLVTPRCPRNDTSCSPAAVIGSVELMLQSFDNAGGGGDAGHPLFNNVPPVGSAAQFTFPALVARSWFLGRVRSESDYGITADTPNIADDYNVYGAVVTLNGTPDGSHAFLTNPTECTGVPLPTVFRANAWESSNVFSSLSDDAPAVTGCDRVPFTPTVDVSPSSTAADSSTGLDVDIKVPQDGLTDPSAIAQSQLKKAVVQLPEGVSVNPSGATGLAGCSDDQIGFGTNDATSCPDGSKIGSVSITSPLLDQDVTGDVYLLSPKSVDPQSGEMFRLAIVARSDRYGLLFKLPGSAVADPVTGRLTATFDNNPRLPFSELKVTLKGGSKGILAMPQQCGTSTSTATLTPWSGTAPVTQSTTTTVGENCANGFDPLFAAGMSTQQAGGSGSFALSFSRADGQQYFKGLTATLPPGLLANVGSVPLCSSEQAAADACPPESRVGSADATAGSGDPFVLEKKGDVYLTEGYKGGAFGLLVHVPVEAGPFTGAFALPTVTVRQALFVDRHDAHVTVVSDDFPTIDAGIPLRIRSVTVNIDRPGFMVNPTSCAPKAVVASLTSTQGASAAVSAPFGVVGCADLPFKPVFAAASRGRLAFKQGAALKVHVGMPAGDANIASVETVLPKELPSRLIPTINNACVYDVFQADYTQCPADSYVGTVTASSPILDQPLRGPVYIVAPPNDVPRLEIVLLGQGKARGVRVDLEGDVIVDIGDGRSKVTFNTVPDVPVTSFDLDLPTGPHSILDAPSNDLCKGPISMFVRIGAQNGKVDEGYRPITVSDCPKIAKVKVVSAKSTSTGLRLRVLAPAEGRIVVSGASLKDVARTVNRKLTYSVTVPLTAKAKKALAKKGKLRTRPTVWFKPVNAKKASTVKTKTLTVKKHNAKKKTKKTKR